MLKNIIKVAAISALGLLSVSAQAGIFSLAVSAWDHPECSEASADLAAAKALIGEAHALTDNNIVLGEGEPLDRLRARVKLAQAKRALRAAAYDLLDCGLLNLDVDVVSADFSIVDPFLVELDLDVDFNSALTQEALIRISRKLITFSQIQLSGIQDEDALNAMEATEVVIQKTIDSLQP